MVDSSRYQVHAEKVFVCWVLNESALGKKLEKLWQKAWEVATGPLSQRLTPIQEENERQILALTKAAIVFRHAPDTDLSKLFLKFAGTTYQFMMRVDTESGQYHDYVIDWSPRQTVK